MKLVELLARELDVWPEIATHAVQDNYSYHARTIWVCRGALENTTRLDGSDGWLLGKTVMPVKMVEPAELATDHATAIVTRSDWEAERARIAKPQEAKWIRHRGGKCPVEAGVLVDVRFRSGEVETDGDWPRWMHNGGSRDIMAYRICEPASLAEPEPLSVDELQAAIGPVAANGPLEWRDRINTIDSDIAAQNEAHRLAIETLEEERVSLVQQLAAEGLQLIGGAQAADEWPEGAPNREDAPEWATHIGRDRYGFNWFDHDPHRFDEDAHVKGCLGDEGYPDGKFLGANNNKNDLPLWSAAI